MPGNGRIIEELRNILNSSEEISGRVVTRLTLAALQKVLENQDEAKEERKEIKRNPAVRFGFFTQRHPKSAIGLLVAFVIMTNMWFVSGWRRPLLQGLLTIFGVPEPIIENIP